MSLVRRVVDHGSNFLSSLGRDTIDIRRQALSGLKWAGITKVAMQLVNWGITLLVVRLLAPEDYGLMASSLAIIAVLSAVAELGLGSSLVQVAELSQTELARVTGLVMLSNVSIAIVVVLVAPLAATALSEPRTQMIIQVSALQFLFSGVSTAPQALLTRDLRFKRLALIELASGVLTNVTTLLLAWLGAGVWALVGGNQVGAAIRAVLLVSSGWVRPTFVFAGIGRHLRFGGQLTIANIVWQFTSQLDVLIAARFLGSSAAGVYSVALNLAQMPMQKIMSVINTVAFPVIARIQDDAEQLRENLQKALRTIAVLGVPFAWGLASVGTEFILLVFGEKWTEVTLPMQILAAIIPLRMLGALLVTAAVAKGSAALQVRNTVVSLIVFPTVFLIGVRWSVPGLAWSLVIGILICYGIIMPRVCVILGIRLADVIRASLPAAVSGLVMCGTILAVRGSVLLPSPPLQLALLIFVGAVTYIAVLTLADRLIWSELRQLFRS